MKMKRKRLVDLALFILFNLPVTFLLADTLSISLNTLNNVDRVNTTGVWNLGLGELHPPLNIINAADLTPTPGTARDINIGDGSDGPFNSSTYTSFGTVSGNEIIFNTNSKSVYNFTTFDLGNNMVIRPTGSNPLIIRSQSDVTIRANAGIDCSGNRGTDSKPYGDTGTIPTSSGGTSRCGGGAGGNGGAPGADGANGTNGDPLGVTITGGFGGKLGVDARGGGGGGGGGGFEPSDNTTTQNDAQDADAAPNTRGIVGTANSTDHFLNNISYGGSGGGGGGGYFALTSNKNGTGAGGGGGGGVIVIHAGRDVTLTDQYSFVVAHGGIGGDAGDGTDVSLGGVRAGIGGAGGGGAGGTIWIAAGRNYSDLAPGSGAYSGVFTRAGDGGSIGNVDRSGGTPSHGRTWITDNDCVSGLRGSDPNCAVSEDNPTSLSNNGQTRYKTGVYEFYSQAIDTRNYKPILNSITVSSSGTGTVTTKILASDNQSFSNPTTEVDPSQISTISNHRYLKLHITLNNASTTTPIKVTSIVVDYTPTATLEFDFKSACGRFGNSLFDLLFFIAIFFFLYKSLTTKLPVQALSGLPNYRVSQNLSGKKHFPVE